MKKPNQILFIPMDGTAPRMVDEEPQAEIDLRKAQVIADSERRRQQRLANRPSSINWARIESFVGYGNIEAPLVFIGMEEGLAKPAALDSEVLRQDLLWRSTFQPVMDAKRAHEGLADGPSLFSDSPRRQQTWRAVADVMLNYNEQAFGTKAERSEARKKYRPKAVGRSVANSLLIELLPYPSTDRKTWLYSERFPSRAEYVTAILPKRVKLISEALGKYQRDAIICYGQEDWPTFKLLFPDSKWKAVNGQYNKFECAIWNGAKVTLTYHFSRFFNKDEELDELSRIALSK